jgi:adenylyltransferase/sulfurtransferase
MDVPQEVDITEAARLFKVPGAVVLLDVREPHERALCRVAGSLHIPMGEVPDRLGELPRDRQILVLCHHGGRSKRVTQFLRVNNYPLATNVAGGIEAWAVTIEPGMPRY